jgi:hypothetical protein
VKTLRNDDFQPEIIRSFLARLFLTSTHPRIAAVSPPHFYTTQFCLEKTAGIDYTEEVKIRQLIVILVPCDFPANSGSFIRGFFAIVPVTWYRSQPHEK